MISDLFKKNNKKNGPQKSRPVSNGTRVLPYILITVITLANILAPISVGLNTKNVPEMMRNETEAASIKLDIKVSKNDTSISVETLVYWYDGEKSTSFEKVFVNIEGEKDGKEYKGVKKVDLYEVSTPEEGVYAESGITEFIDLNPETTYKITAVGMQSELDPKNIINLISTGGLSYFWGTTIDKVSAKVKSDTIEVTTLKSGNTSFEDGGTSTYESKENYMPVCGLKIGGIGQGSLGGCIAQGIYYLFFIPTSFIFAVAGTLFDWTFAYSVGDGAYRSTFVEEGWKIVRDFCNMFFIFILLYIAFKTILGLGASKTKEMIINVIIIGLLINFSLFATRVIIDASNILARVFYNSDAIKITQTEGDLNIPNMIKKTDESGIIPLSEALINKVNPQNLILNANRINVNDPANQSDSNTNKKKGGVTTGTFIVVTLLASGINVVGFIVFLTVALLFIGRVVGLWLAMILSPFAFFSYTVPEMQGWPTVGWKVWWPETLKLAFLAPVFIFFLYLILQFLEVGLGVLDAEGKGTLGFLISILMPFAFIMILLMKAKGIAIKMAGQIGETVAKAGSAVGGLALGAATGGAALAMRGTLGRMGASIANSEKLKAAEAKGGFGGFLAARTRDFGKYTGKSSFDARATKLGASAGSALGTNLGKAKEGGFIKGRADEITKKQKRAKELSELGEQSTEVKKLRAQEVRLKKLQNEKSHDLHDLDGKLEAARQDVKDANSAVLASPKDKKLREAAQAASERVRKLVASKSGINNGKVIYKIDKDGYLTDQAETNKDDGTYKYHTDNGNITEKGLKDALDRASDAVENLAKANKELEIATQNQKDHPSDKNREALELAKKNQEAAVKENGEAHMEKVLAETSAKKGLGKSILEIQYGEIPHAQHAVEKVKNERLLQYSESITNPNSVFFNYLISGGQYTESAAKEAAVKIIKEAKIENTGGGGHGGGGGGHAPAPKAESKKEEHHEEKHAGGGDGHEVHH